MIVDTVMFNGEFDILKLRLAMLYDHVDKFIIVEAKTTFSGLPKPLYFSHEERLFEQWWPKIDYFVIDEDYTDEERELAASSPNTVGAKHWQNEFLQKESIKKALVHLQDDDLVYIGDVDEIWSPKHRYIAPEKLLLRVYAYYLDNLSSEVFWGPLMAKYSEIKGVCLNHMRSDISLRGEVYAGWHFTSIGGLPEIRRKLNDSYTTESYNTYEVQELLPKRFINGEDYLGRNFTFEEDMEDWPTYLKQHKHIYKHLLKSYGENKHEFVAGVANSEANTSKISNSDKENSSKKVKSKTKYRRN